MRLCFSLWFACLPCVFSGLSHAQERATADARVTIVSPAEASARQATLLLFNPTPGVLTLTLAGATGPVSLELTATSVDPASGAFTFAVSGGSSPARISVIEQLACAMPDTNLSTGLSLSGFINGMGVQLVVLEAGECAQGDGSLKAIITFD